MSTDSGAEYEYWQSTQYLEYRFGLSFGLATAKQFCSLNGPIFDPDNSTVDAYWNNQRSGQPSQGCECNTVLQHCSCAASFAQASQSESPLVSRNVTGTGTVSVSSRSNASQQVWGVGVFGGWGCRYTRRACIILCCSLRHAGYCGTWPWPPSLLPVCH